MVGNLSITPLRNTLYISGHLDHPQLKCSAAERAFAVCQIWMILCGWNRLTDEGFAACPLIASNALLASALCRTMINN
jgi:predicted benzoate:H+ symporter BenE